MVWGGVGGGRGLTLTDVERGGKGVGREQGVVFLQLMRVGPENKAAQSDSSDWLSREEGQSFFAQLCFLYDLQILFFCCYAHVHLKPRR